MARSGMTIALTAATVGLALLHGSLARQCPDCDAQYWTCSWKCFETEGWQPICAQLESFTDGDNPPNPENEEVFASACQAECYVEAFRDFDRVSDFSKKYDQKTSEECEAAWKTKQASDYIFYSTQAFLYDGLLPSREELPEWLQSEVAAVEKDDSLDMTEIAATLDECTTCKAFSGDNAIPQTVEMGPAAAPEEEPDVVVEPDTVAPEPVAAAETPTAPLPEPVPEPEPEPSPVPSPVPSPEPTPEPSAAYQGQSSLIMMAASAGVALLAIPL
ncbi:hypothetical protein M9435_002907 [Picochlorum sp. BPE23]|nr:hypothetical protein M9435_002907 [Picochlorum sp. BPE23]